MRNKKCVNIVCRQKKRRRKEKRNQNVFFAWSWNYTSQSFGHTTDIFSSVCPNGLKTSPKTSNIILIYTFIILSVQTLNILTWNTACLLQMYVFICPKVSSNWLFCSVSSVGSEPMTLGSPTSPKLAPGAQFLPGFLMGDLPAPSTPQPRPFNLASPLSDSAGLYTRHRRRCHTSIWWLCRLIVGLFLLFRCCGRWTRLRPTAGSSYPEG